MELSNLQLILYTSKNTKNIYELINLEFNLEFCVKSLHVPFVCT